MTSDPTPSEGSAAAGRGSSATAVVLVATLIGLPLVIGLVILGLLAAAVTFVAVNASQASIACSETQGGARGPGSSLVQTAAPAAARPDVPARTQQAATATSRCWKTPAFTPVRRRMIPRSLMRWRGSARLSV